MTSIVSIDIETTGLDENREAIIEIAAVKFSNRRVENEFSTLVNPGKHIPDFITGLTGIDDKMVREAPRLRDIAHELTAFVGDSPILGHNVKFDIGFLRKAGLFEYHQTIDTYELAAVLMPTASRYNLGALGQQLSIPLPATHRALDDARVTQAAYVRLLDMAKELPLEALQEIVELGGGVDWDAGWVFEQALQLRAKEGIKPKRTQHTPTPQAEDLIHLPEIFHPSSGTKNPSASTLKKSRRFWNTADRSRNISKPTSSARSRWTCSRR